MLALAAQVGAAEQDSEVGLVRKKQEREHVSLTWTSQRWAEPTYVVHGMGREPGIPVSTQLI